MAVKKDDISEQLMGSIAQSSDAISNSTQPDYCSYSRDKLIEELKKLTDMNLIPDIGDKPELIKAAFYKRLKLEIEQKHKKFLEEGGVEEDFKLLPDEKEQEFKRCYKRYRELKQKYTIEFEKQKEKNYQQRLLILDELIALLTRQESLNKTFEEFRDIERRFRQAGPVPQVKLAELMNQYNTLVEKFYDYVRINKELRDFDLKKNLDFKESLIVKSQLLLDEPDVITAFRKLQDYHEQWRDSGPVAKAYKDDIWNRFKSVTTAINKKHHEFFRKLKDELDNNLEKKLNICAEIEKIIEVPFTSFADCRKKTETIMDLQKKWKETGNVPRKEMITVMRRFRKAGNSFFKKKREYMGMIREQFAENSKKKIAVCETIEQMINPPDWEAASKEVIRIQRQWRDMGPVGKKEGEELWQRFSAACDGFFKRKAAYHKSLISVSDDNCKKKDLMLREFEAVKPSGDLDQDIKTIREFQQQWNAVGSIPPAKREGLQKRFNMLVNNWYQSLPLDERKKQLYLFKNRIHQLSLQESSGKLLYEERDRLIRQLHQMEHDIIKWENNMGFFRASKSAEKLLADMNGKIVLARNDIKQMEEKIKVIDNYLSNKK